MKQIDRERPYRQNAPGARSVTSATIETLDAAVIGGARPALWVLLGAVSLLLLIACVNVGTMLVLRVTRQEHEIAIRRALGASLTDIVRKLCLEGAMLAIAGGALGLACAAALLRVLLNLSPPELPRLDVIHLAGTPTTVSVAVTLSCLGLIVLVPVLTVVDVTIGSPLGLAVRSRAGTVTRRRVRQWLVASQVALAAVMVTGAGLLARSLEQLGRITLGFRPDHLSLVWVARRVTPQNAEERLTRFVEGVAVRFGDLPEFVATTPSMFPPFLGTQIFSSGWEPDGHAHTTGVQTPTVPIEVGDADYFRTFGIALARGRGFQASDGANDPLVAVVSDAAARLFWPGQDPLGRHIRIAGESGPAGAWRTVVGVAADIRYRTLRQATPTVYLPWRQAGVVTVLLAVRTRGTLEDVLPELQRTVSAVDPEATIVRSSPVDKLLARQLEIPRLSTVLLSAFGIVALVLAALGLYGVMASVVREQWREIGIRMALGATARRVHREVLGRSLAVAGIGALVGLTVSLAGARVVRSVLFGVSPTDPVTLIGACGLLMFVAFGAALLPARHATRATQPAVSVPNNKCP